LGIFVLQVGMGWLSIIGIKYIGNDEWVPDPSSLPIFIGACLSITALAQALT
jgi:hypothetical protein